MENHSLISINITSTSMIEFLKLSHIPPCKGTCLLQDYVQFIFVMNT